MNNVLMTSIFLTVLVYFSSCQSGVKTVLKSDSVTVSNPGETVLAKPALSAPTADAIEGHYISSALEDGVAAPGCQITLDIVKRQEQYFYTLISDTTYKGIVSISKSEDGKESYVTFEGIEWAEYEGDISNDSEEEREQKPVMELPVGIGGQLQDKEIIIQNYGNSMNYYVKLSGCGDKYIRLVKK